MSTTWELSTTFGNIQGTSTVDDEVVRVPYLPAGTYHWRAIANDAGGTGNNITLHKFDATAEGFPTAAFNDNDAGWAELGGINAFRSQLLNDADEVALDIADAGATYVNQGWLGTSSGDSVRDAAQVFTLSSDLALGKLKIYVNVKNGTGASGVTLGIYSGSTYGDGGLYASRSGQNLTTAASWFTSGELAAGIASEGIFLIHDAGQTYMDAGANQSWDFSSFSHSTDFVNVKYQYASYAADQSFADAAAVEAGASWNGTWLTLAELQAETDTGNRYFYMKCKVTSTGSTYSSLTGDVYSTDVTPPAVPTVAKVARFQTDNYGLIWTEPTDADYDHCELKRIIDSTTTYLNSVTGIATWQESEGTPFEFIDDDATAGWMQSNYTDEDISGTSIAHYVRSVDTNDNASAWTLFSDATITLPGTPSITTTTAGDEQVVLAVVPSAETDVLYARYRENTSGEAWSSESETFKRTGSGNITITGLNNRSSYEFIVYAKATSGIISVWSAPKYAIPIDGSDSTIEQIMDAVVTTINNASLTDSDDDSITAEVEIPPEFNSVTTAQIKVFPSEEQIVTHGCGSREKNPKVVVAICERVTKDAQKTNLMANAETIKQLFVGRRLTGMTQVYCTEATEDITDDAWLRDHEQWIGAIEFTFNLVA